MTATMRTMRNATSSISRSAQRSLHQPSRRAKQRVFFSPRFALSLFSVFFFFFVFLRRKRRRGATATSRSATRSWQRLLSGDWRRSPIDQSRGRFHRAPSCPNPNAKRRRHERSRKRTIVPYRILAAALCFHPCISSYVNLPVT